MTLMQGIRLYPKAILWAGLISICCVMEGYDVALLGTTDAVPFPSQGLICRRELLCFPPVQQGLWKAASERRLSSSSEVASRYRKWQPMWSNNRSFVYVCGEVLVQRSIF